MPIQDVLQEIIDSPEQATVVKLRKGHPGLAMPSVPIPKLPATEFLADDSGKQVKVRIFDLDAEIVILVVIDKEAYEKDE
jgi:hypothetical protein